MAAFFIETPISRIALELDRDDLLPAIVFRTARSQCDRDVEKAARNGKLHISREMQVGMKKRIREIARIHDMDPELLSSHPHYNALLLTGIGAHHAGQLLMWRLLLEELMARGYLNILVATGTVAAGVDFPARTVVITAHSKRGAEGFLPLTASEFQQMSGRAGRRGKDTVGFCIAAPSRFCDPAQLIKRIGQAAEPLVSAYFPSPSTVLNLLRYQNVDGLRYTVEKSLAAFVDRRNAEEMLKEADSREGDISSGPKEQGGDEGELSKEEKKLLKKVRRLRRQAEELRGRQKETLETSLRGLEKLGYIQGTSLSEKGFWAANLCTSIVLELGEFVAEGVLDGADLEGLVAIVASISGDSHRRYLEATEGILDDKLVEHMSSIIERIRNAEVPGVVGELCVLPDAAMTVLSWFHAEGWQEFRSLLSLLGIAEGDAARLITQTAEHLNQLARLEESHPRIAQLSERARFRLLRPPLSEVVNLEGISEL